MKQHPLSKQPRTFRTSWLWKFCRTQLKRHRLLYLIAQWVWDTGGFFYLVAWIYLTNQRRYPLVPLAAHAHSSMRIVLAPVEAIATPTPQVFPASFSTCLIPPHAQYVFPEIYIAAISNALVTGGTNLIMADQAIVCHDLYDCAHDYTSEELHRKTYAEPTRNRLAWLMPTHPQQRLPRGACFTDACAANYAHWMTEVLPRINQFCLNEKSTEIPLVINAGLHSNLMESLKIVAGEARKIITVTAEENILIEELICTSVAGYIPFERRNNRLKNHSHGLFSPYGLTALRDHLRRNLPKASGATKNRIIIRRNSGIRNVSNAKEIEDVLIARGFIVVEPERLSFEDQVELFSNADVVVGATGAAFANLIFCNPSAKIIIMISDYKYMPYWYWQNMACAVGNKVTYVIGKSRDTIARLHSDFTINPSDVLEAIAWEGEHA